jgi:serine/threonine protein kinase
MEQNIGKYKYSDIPIGHGSFSFVYKGFDKLTGKVVAIKKINIKFNKNLNKEQIESEINIMKNLEHKNIVKLYDYLYDKYDNVYLIMEYCSKGNLSDFLNNKPMKEKYVKIYMRQISEATNYLYQHKIIHRDIKPQNIMIDDNKNIKLTDFGFAKIFKTGCEDDFMSQTICGSPIYMAPEIIKCNKYSIKTDLWSIGVVFYEMLIGRLPYKASTHIELINKIESEPIYIPLNMNISEECKDFLFKLLQSNPKKRITWEDFFKHKWLGNDYNLIRKSTDNDIDNDIDNNDIDNNDIDLTQLVDDYDYSIHDSDDDQYCIPMDSSEPLSTKRSKPIPIKKVDSSSSESEIENNDSYISPMFNTPLIFTPNNNNGYIIIQPENNGGGRGENFNINIDTERSISESLMNYMNQTVNYFRSYYYS